jgi:HK97 family phage portal protein
MVLPVTTFFGSTQKSLNRPMLNDLPIITGMNTSKIGYNKFNYRKFWNDFRRNPELMSPISVLVTDISSDEIYFTDVKGMPLGRNKVYEARDFWKKNRGKETVKAALFDLFVTGDAYLYKAYATPDQKLKAVKEVLRKYEGKEFYNELMIKAAQDEDLKKPKKFDYIAASTIQILNDNYDILGYVQQTNGLTSKFNPEEIIHFRLNTVDGHVNGYTPMESIVAEMALLWLVKGNMIAVMESGGSPDRVFVLPQEIANSTNHKMLVETLQKYNNVRNWHGNLVFTGEVDIKEIGAKIKDLEYKDLALYITSNIAYAFGVPVTRIPYLVGNSATNGDSGGMSESGYWHKISEIQEMIEDLLNAQLFDQLGWNFHFSRKYKQDEVRESQIFSMNADTVTKLQNIYRMSKKRVKVEKINQILDLSDDDLEEIPESELMMPMEKTGLMNQNLLSNNNINKEPDNRKRADTKRNVANSKGAESAGV